MSSQNNSDKHNHRNNMKIHDDDTDSDILIPRNDTNQDIVYNFAFGANMSSKVLTGRRKIKPISSEPAILYDYELAFTLRGVPYIEPCFGNIEYNKNSCVHGLLHKMTSYDFMRLMSSEAGSNETKHGYIAKEVTCVTYDGKKIIARALQCVDGSRQYVKKHELLYPSQRYMNLLINGAIEYNLDKQYISWLKSYPTQSKHVILYIMWILITLLHIICLSPVFITITTYFTLQCKSNKFKPYIVLVLIESLWLYCKLYDKLYHLFISKKHHIKRPMYFISDKASPSNID